MTYKNNWNDKKLKRLVKYFTDLKNSKETQSWLTDLLTPQEIDDFTKRLECAILIAHKESYREIAKKLNLSTTTVTRVARWAKDPKGGFTKLYNRLNE